MTTIVWFRQDLRVADNPALAHAAERGPVVPVYIFDETDPRTPGGASRWWLHHSLQALENSLGGMIFFRGDPLQRLLQLAQKSDAEAIYWNRCYEPHAVARDTTIKEALRKGGLEAESFNAGLLFEPWELKTGSGGPYRVYSPFWRAALQHDPGTPVVAAETEYIFPPGIGDQSDDWNLLPSKPDWAADWSEIWAPGEKGAEARLDAFVANGLRGYASGRDRPDLQNVSRLSPHLHFGEISPRQVYARINWTAAERPELAGDAKKFLAEIGWREFCYHLLYHFPGLPDENWKREFDEYPWRESKEDLSAWQLGMTGYPLVDAGMRELWRTGTMHNRVRMIAASFLTKHLRLHWKFGEAWFWDTLVDADLANNACGWQWVAGSGADAAPYFRIFNPTTQARKFDPDGHYIRRWCPELAELSNKEIHAPFELPETRLKEAGVVLGETYPWPIVDHGAARKNALQSYEHAKEKAAVQ